MKLNVRPVALLASALLAACGGGGGGSAPVTAPAVVALTETNAKPVSANALDSVQSTSATRDATGLPIGVQVDAQTQSGQNNFAAIAQVALTAATSLTGAAAGLPTGVAVSETDACPLGGSLTISGNVAGGSGLFAGDSLSINASNCQVSVAGVTTLMNGRMTMTLNSGGISSIPFHVNLTVAATDLSVQSGGLTAVASGDVRLDWTVSSASSETLVASGSSFTSRETVGGTAHSNTLRNYTQSLIINGPTLTGTLAATVETDSTRVGAGGGSYTVTTPAAVVWNSSTGVVSAGVIKVVGAANSQLLITVDSNSAVAVQLDANGDGAFEKTISTSVTELKSLL